MAYQQELDSTLWCVRADGELCSLAYQPDQDVIGWARHIPGGAYRGGQACAESVAVIPGDNADELWLVVRRTVGGGTRRFIEVFAPAFETGGDPAMACYADAALVHDQPVAITAASQTDPVVVSAPSHGFADGDKVRLSGIRGMTEIDGGVFLVADPTADAFALRHRETGLPVDGTNFGVYADGGEARRLSRSFAGLDHLEGETVAILTDGAVHPARTVTGGAVTLDDDAATVVAGLPYSHTYESLKWEAGSAIGTAQGQTKRIHGVTLILLDSLNAEIGPDAASLKTVPFRRSGDAMDRAVPLFTGERYVEFDGDYATDTRVMIRGRDPVPFTLLAVAPVIRTNTR
jgi:hypothetical protein